MFVCVVGGWGEEKKYMCVKAIELTFFKKSTLSNNMGTYSQFC